jgi:diacylglycerol kinase (CTP)
MGMDFKARNDIHLARRIWHFAGVLVIFGLYWVLAPRQALIAVVSASVLLISFDFSRIYLPFFNRLFTFMFQPVLRDSEQTRISGLSYLMAGVTVVVAIFPKPVGLLALLFLAVADPLASFFGIRYGKDKLFGHKSVQGSLAAFTACFFLSLGFFLYMDMMRERLFIVCLLGGIIGAFSELVPIFDLDDNFVFPVVSSALLFVLFYVFGGLSGA